jgi:uncharacterized protein YabE (DUF348 family)
LIVNDQRFATFVATSVLTLVLSFTASSSAFAAAEVAGSDDAQPVIVTFVHDGQATMYETRARTVAEFLDERGVKAGQDDFVAPAADTALVPGLRLEYRAAMALSLVVDGQRISLHIAPASVEDLLDRAGVKLGPYDQVVPALAAHPTPGTVVRVVRVDEWTAHVREPIEPGVRHRFDPELAIGKTRTIDQGLPGERELTVRFVKRGDGPEKRTVLASRVIQEARPRVIVHGIGEFASLVDGVRDALHIAGTAMKMVATAYVPFCSGCSGITKLGLHAGHGVVAVDPNVIPLGSRLYVPGYGNAVAGDTGTASISGSMTSAKRCVSGGDRSPCTYCDNSRVRFSSSPRAAGRPRDPAEETSGAAFSHGRRRRCAHREARRPGGRIAGRRGRSGHGRIDSRAAGERRRGYGTRD